jgi:hypothetical protein
MTGAKTMLTKAKDLFGKASDGNPPCGFGQPYLNAFAAGGYNDGRFRPALAGIGKAAKALMARDSDVGLFTDSSAPKLPAGKKAKNAVKGAPSFHEDVITFAVDRSGGGST